MKERALKIANDLYTQHIPVDEIAFTIRRLVEELDKQTKPTITKLHDKVVAVTMTDDEHRVHEVLWEAPKPLSDEEIKEIYEKCWEGILTAEEIDNSEVRFARAIEERHGIK